MMMTASRKALFAVFVVLGLGAVGAKNALDGISPIQRMSEKDGGDATPKRTTDAEFINQGLGLEQDEVALSSGVSPLMEAYESGKLLVKSSEQAVLQHFHVPFPENGLEKALADLQSIDGLAVRFQGKHLRHIMVQVTKQSQLSAILGLDWVDTVEMSQKVRGYEEGLPVDIGDSEPLPPFGLDAIDGAPYDGQYTRVLSGAGVEVYVLDTGVDSTHTEIAGRVGTGQGFASGNPGTTNDAHGHGTHCAGTIAGTQVGVAPGATIIPVKVLGDDGYGSDSDIIAGLDWVIDIKQNRDAMGGGARMVISASIGGSYSPALDDAFNQASNAGIVTVVAAGNDDDDASNYSPAGADKVISVGALDAGSNPAIFSNYGSKVDIWAPGVYVYSAAANTGSGLTYQSGTSMACPHVSGVVALMLEAHPEWTVDEVKNHLYTECMEDANEIKWSTGKMLRTWASRGSQSTCAASGSQKAFSKWWSDVQGNCMVDEKCISSPNYPSNYAASDNCQATSRVSGTVISEHFATEEDQDNLTINSVQYSGDLGEITQQVNVGSALTWETNGNEQMKGWKVCVDSDPMWVIDFGSCTTDGTCLRTPNYPHNYDASSSCRAHLTESAIVKSTGTVELELNHAYLIVNGAQYTGEGQFEGNHFVADTSIVWISDDNETRKGFELCITGVWSSTVRSLPALALVSAFLLSLL